jgi:lipoyl(octanoyl) transferase
MQKVVFQDLGRISYQAAWDMQEEKLSEVVGRKLDNRKRGKQGLPEEPQQHHLLFCEHHPVYTLGKSGSMDHLLLGAAELEQRGFEFFKINRGGDITYHGPGQIVGYPIFDLDCFFTDVHRYVRYLEEAVIRTIADYGLQGRREKGYTGVWLPETATLPKRKICAIGVHLRRWVTLHGFAFNVNTDLSHFNYIVPCGINEAGRDVTSLERELGASVDLEEAKAKLKEQLACLFEFEYASKPIKSRSGH